MSGFFHRMEVGYACRPEWRLMTEDIPWTLKQNEDVHKTRDLVIQVYRERPDLIGGGGID